MLESVVKLYKLMQDLLFFFSEREYRTNQKQKKNRNFSIVRLVSKISHSRQNKQTNKQTKKESKN